MITDSANKRRQIVWQRKLHSIFSGNFYEYVGSGCRMVYNGVWQKFLVLDKSASIKEVKRRKWVYKPYKIYVSQIKDTQAIKFTSADNHQNSIAGQHFTKRFILRMRTNDGTEALEMERIFFICCKWRSRNPRINAA